MSDNPNPEIHSIRARAPPGLSPHMVRSTIIVRASDALPLAASVDDEQVSLPLHHPPHLHPSALPYRQNKLCKNTSSKLNSSSGALHPTPSLGARLRALNIHYSSRRRFSYLFGVRSPVLLWQLPHSRKCRISNNKRQVVPPETGLFLLG